MSTYLIFGGTGSLGRRLLEHALLVEKENRVYNASRDELKQKDLSRNLFSVENIICDVRDSQRVQQVLLEVDPHYVIFASALKHVDSCERSVLETVKTNTLGLQNVLAAATELRSHAGKNLVSIVYISTDKACAPESVYGFSKALGERLMTEYAHHHPSLKINTVRFGNILDSSGSILPLLREWVRVGSPLLLTHPEMTRFFMLVQDAVELVWYALHQFSRSGEVLVAKTWSARVRDLFELFASKYNREIRVVGARPGETLHETIISLEEWRRAEPCGDLYVAIRPYLQGGGAQPEERVGYRSDQNVVTREQLAQKLDTNLLW